MKISEKFKESTKNTIDENEIKNYAIGIYGLEKYEDLNSNYVNATKRSDSEERDYEDRIDLLINRFMLLHNCDEFQNIKNISKNIMLGESRKIIDEIRKSIERICYILEKNLLKNRSRFSLALEGIDLHVCLPGVFTRIQNVLYSMSDDLYEIKYQYILNIALQYAKEKMQYDYEYETHVVNTLIHEVSRIYFLIPSNDYFAHYRDLNKEPDNKSLVFYQFRDYLDNKFNSKESINSLLDNYLDNFIYFFEANDMNFLNKFCSDANITISDLMEEDIDTLKLKPTGLDLARILIVKKLIREDVISYEPITFQNGDELLEFPDSWYLLSKDNNVKKVLDTTYFAGFKINGKDLELVLSDKLRSGSYTTWEDFLDFINLDRGIKGYLSMTPLHWAAAKGSLNLVKMLIDAGAEINSVESNGNTPLHIALKYRNYDIAKYLLKSGAKVHMKNESGVYPIFQVINNFSCPHYEKVQLLNLILNADDFDSSVKDKDGVNPLEEVCIYRLTDIIPMFINKGFDVTNCLYSALRYNDTDIFKIILDSLDNIDGIHEENGFTPLHYTAIAGKLDYMEAIISKMTNLSAVDNSGETALHSIVHGIITWDEDILIAAIKLIIKKDPSIINIQNKNGDTPLHLMIRCGFTEAAKILIEQEDLEMKINNYFEGYLDLAFSSNNIEIIKAFLNSSHDISQDMQTILNWSVAFLWDVPIWRAMKDLNSLDNILDERTKMFNKIFNNIDPISKCIFMYMINSEDRNKIIQYSVSNIQNFVSDSALSVVRYLYHNAVEMGLIR